MAALPESSTALDRLAVYMRVSSEEQRQQRTIDVQRLAAERYCAVHELQPAGWYADDGVSGTIPLDKRPEGSRLLADTRAGKVGAVLVWRLDRFGRNARAILNATADLQAMGVRLVSITEAFDTNTPAGRLQLNMLSSIAEFERDSIVERISGGTQKRLDAGGWMGGRAPYGYRVVGVDREARLVIYDDTPIEGLTPVITEAGVVQLVYTRTVEDGWSCQRIADHLNALKVPTAYARDGKRYKRGDREHPTLGIWRVSSVYALLTNPLYKGVATYGERPKHRAPVGKPGPRQTPQEPAPHMITHDVPDLALVDAAMWDAAQDRMRARAMWHPNHTKADYLLQGAMRCAACGHLYGGATEKRGSPRRIYVDRGRARAAYLYGRERAEAMRCQHNMTLNAEKIEAKVWTEIDGYLRDPGRALALLAAELEREHGRGSDVQAQIAAAQGHLAEYQAERDRVIALFRRGRISEAELDAQLDAVDRDALAARADVERLQAEWQAVISVEATLHSAEQLLTELRHRLDSEPMTFALRRQIVERLVRGITVHADAETMDGWHRSATVRVRYRFNRGATITLGVPRGATAGTGSDTPPAAPRTTVASSRLRSHSHLQAGNTR